MIVRVCMHACLPSCFWCVLCCSVNALWIFFFFPLWISNSEKKNQLLWSRTTSDQSKGWFYRPAITSESKIIMIQPNQTALRALFSHTRPNDSYKWRPKAKQKVKNILPQMLERRHVHQRLQIRKHTLLFAKSNDVTPQNNPGSNTNVVNKCCPFFFPSPKLR